MTDTQVPARLFALLRQMDAEATSSGTSGNPTGLSDYGRHVRRGMPNPKNEVEWSKRIFELLTLDGVSGNLEVEYPEQSHLPKRKRKRCDLRLGLAGSKTMMIEVKGAWSDYWGRGHRIYRSYLLHPLISGLDATKTHTVPFDLVKLTSLSSADADYIGQLLIGFEKITDPMDKDVEELVTLAGLSEWHESCDSWLSKNVPGQRVRCWFWYRETKSK